MEWQPARRAVSVANANDFSWLKRLAAWEGALQMMAEKPGFGFGWNLPEKYYEQFYRAPKIDEAAAIEMNDYLMLGSTLGIQALFCFAAYIWLSLTQGRACHSVRAESEKPDGGTQGTVAPYHPPSSIFLSATCRARAIVLLVGFWFDGGLFKLATGATFWILLELGSQREVPSSPANPVRLESQL